MSSLQRAESGIVRYVIPPGRRGHAYWLIAGGIGLVLLAVFGFYAAVVGQSNVFRLQLSTTVPLLVALGLFSAAWRSLRTAIDVRLSDDGIEAHYSDGRAEHWQWEAIAMAKTTPIALSNNKCLTLFGTDARALLRLSEDLEPFAELSQSINQHMAARPSPANARVERSKSRRNGALLLVFSLMAWGLGAANLWLSLSDREAHRLLAEKAQPTTATITKKIIAPDGHTHRFYYKVDNVGPDAPEANIEVNPLLWEFSAEGSHLDVMAVPGRPDITHLVSGQIDSDSPSPNVMIPISVVFLIVGALVFIVAIMNLRGLDIAYARGKGIYLKRVGERPIAGDAPK